MSLIARYLESNGLPTVVMGCARDIVESCGVARFLFSDFPLGNSCGKPFDKDSQRDTLARALALFDDAEAPRTTAVSPQRWAEDDAWKRDFMSIEGMDAGQLERRRSAFDAQKAVANEIKRPA